MTNRLGQLPRALRHRQSINGLQGIWRKIQRTITSPRVLAALPPFVNGLAKTFWDLTPSDATTALARGDCAFFVAFQMRLDQIDCAMVNAGLGTGDRAPVTRAKWLVEGFRMAAEKNLRAKGGQWPPTVADAPGESSHPASPSESPPQHSDGSHPSREEQA